MKIHKKATKILKKLIFSDMKFAHVRFFLYLCAMIRAKVLVCGYESVYVTLKINTTNICT